MEYEIVQIIPAPYKLEAAFWGDCGDEYEKVACLALVEWEGDGEVSRSISPCVIDKARGRIMPCFVFKNYIGVTWKDT